MRELVIGKGFIGKAYGEYAASQGSEVFPAGRHPQGANEYYVDLNDPATISETLNRVRPDVIVNCAAILGRNPGDKLESNPIFTGNILESASKAGLNLSRIVILGSAAEYGPVTQEDLPIAEDAPLNPNTAYGESKKVEVETALHLAEEYDLPVVVGRIFNPLGPGLHPSNLTSRVLGQIQAIRSGEQPPVIEVRNLDAARDYLHVKDCVRAMGLLASAGKLPHNVYNIGSGDRTTNREIIELVLDKAGVTDVDYKATDEQSEPLVGAVQADISRLTELGYTPEYDIERTVEEVVVDSGFASSARDAA